MAVVVVAIHIQPLTNCENYFVTTMFTFLSNIAVPFFFVSSGYFLFEKFDINGEFGSKENMKVVFNYLKKTISLYIVWWIIYTPMAVCGYYLTGDGILKSVVLYLRNMVFMGVDFYSWQLWYLLALIYSVALIFAFQKNKCKEVYLIITGILLYVFGYLITGFAAAENYQEGVVEILHTLVINTIHSGRILSGVGFVIGGLLLSRKNLFRNKSYERIVMYAIVLISLVITFISPNLIRGFFIWIPSVALFDAARLTDVNLTEIVSFNLRKASSVIYFSHMIFFFAYISYVSVFGIFEVGYSGIFVFCTVLSCSVILSAIVLYIRKYSNSKLKAVLRIVGWN